MNIIISNSGGTPIYEQIASQIKSAILSGQLKEGDALPSMRLLAKELRISVITTKRAYEELEREGFIVSMTGRGSFVAGVGTELIREQHLRRVEELLREAAREAALCGLSSREFMEMASLVTEQETEDSLPSCGEEDQ